MKKIHLASKIIKNKNIILKPISIDHYMHFYKHSSNKKIFKYMEYQSFNWVYFCCGRYNMDYTVCSDCLAELTNLFYLYFSSIFCTHAHLLSCCLSCGHRLTPKQVPLTKEDWKTVLLWSSPILLVDEILKFVGRRLQAKEKAQAALQQNQAVTTSF